jgi:diguanylate cyclase (GGDEF)-like protein/PAS domain S-box-containing protein
VMSSPPRGREVSGRVSAMTAFAAFGVGALCWLSNLSAPLDRAFVDLQTKWLERPIDSDIAIIEIDERSLHQLGTWPWRRSRHAELVDQLQRLGARRIFIDIDFSAPSGYPEDDEELALALARAKGSIVLPAFWQPLSSQSNALILSEPLPAISRTPSVQVGSVNLVPGNDGLVRDIPDMTSLSSRSIRPVWMQLLPPTRHAAGTSLSLDYRIAPSSFATFSYVDILQHRVQVNLAGKTVFVGATAIELGDIVPVPVYRALPGVVVQALSYESARRTPLRHAGPVSVLASLCAWAFACAFWLTRASWRKVHRPALVLLIAPIGFEVAVYAWADFIIAPSPFLATSVTALTAALLKALNLEALRSWRALLRLRHQDVLLRQIVDTSIDGILTLDDGGNVRDANNAAALLLGKPLEQLLGQSFRALAPNLQSDLELLREDRAPLTRSTDLVHSNGLSLPIDVVMTRLAWEDSFVISVSIRDVSTQWKREEELRYHATHDGLTGLSNRRLLAERLRDALDQAREVNPFALLLLDLDGFKQVNDTFGHSTGDDLLVELGRRLQALATSCRCVARIGGDEFALLLTEVQTQNLGVIFKNVQCLVQSPISVQGVPISLATRIGVSIYPTHGTDSELLLRRADIALYSAKRKHSAVEVYDSSLDVSSPRHLQMLAEFRSAIARAELAIHFQPKVSLRTGAPVSVEALCRWRSAVFGDVSPGEFIPLIEASDLIRPLTEWTLRQSLECCREWRAQGCELKVAVNLSVRHLQDDELPGWLEELLISTDTPPGWLELEITESAIMTDTDRAVKTLGAIRRLGITLSIDDYGTGYSSLAYLQKLAVNRLKIDKSFIAGLGQSEHDQLIVKSTIDLAHGLGLDVIAEGIETQGQYAMLQRMGCDYGQGYLIAKAMPPDLLVGWYSLQQDCQATTPGNVSLDQRRT